MEPKLFYQQPAARVGDVIPKYIDGKYQLFYLKNWRDHNAPGFVPGWHRMETTDLVHMGPESPIGCGGRHRRPDPGQGRGVALVCLHLPRGEAVCHPLHQPRRLPGPLGAARGGHLWPRWGDLPLLRLAGPPIVYREDLGEYWMYLAARMNLPHSQTGGCGPVRVQRPENLGKYRQPAYFPQRFNGRL